MLELNDKGLYCPAGDFYIDPWKPVNKAIITHAHSDHARHGHSHYLAVNESEHVLRLRLGNISLEILKYYEEIKINGVKISLHPAGHILGSSQVRVEYKGEIWVVSGDYKTDDDPTCRNFEPVKCHTFITESTFGIPVYKWQSRNEIFSEINDWWRNNNEKGKTSLIFAYSLGKAQRIIAGVDKLIGEIYCHGAVQNMNKAYRQTLIDLPETILVNDSAKKNDYQGALVVAPPSADTPAWTRKFNSPSKAFASGWMQIRGNRRRRAVERGFVMSDHADWNGLLTAIYATEAENILITHGYTEILKRYLNEKGYDASALKTEYSGESDDSSEDQK